MQQVYTTTLKVVETILSTHRLSGELTAQVSGVASMYGVCEAKITVEKGQIISCVIANDASYISGAAALKILYEKGKLDWTLQSIQVAPSRNFSPFDQNVPPPSPGYSAQPPLSGPLQADTMTRRNQTGPFVPGGSGRMDMPNRRSQTTPFPTGSGRMDTPIRRNQTTPFPTGSGRMDTPAQGNQQAPFPPPSGQTDAFARRNQPTPFPGGYAPGGPAYNQMPDYGAPQLPVVYSTTIFQRHPYLQPPPALVQSWLGWQRQTYLLLNGQYSVQQIITLVSREDHARVVQFLRDLYLAEYIITV